MHVKRSTYENYVYLLNRHIFPYLKESNMRGITCSIPVKSVSIKRTSKPFCIADFCIMIYLIRSTVCLLISAVVQILFHQPHCSV
ncbi:MAG: hypothetical protein ACI4DP_10265 [Candidatus Ornithomonoglobus sp.]